METFKSVRAIGKQIIEQNITHWHQLTNPETMKVLSLQGLSHTKGIRVNKLYETSWEKLVSTVTDEDRILLHNYGRNNKELNAETSPNCSNLMKEPQRLDGDGSFHYVFTDGSVKTKSDLSKIAISAAFFDEGHTSNLFLEL